MTGTNQSNFTYKMVYIVIVFMRNESYLIRLNFFQTFKTFFFIQLGTYHFDLKILEYYLMEFSQRDIQVLGEIQLRLY